MADVAIDMTYGKALFEAAKELGRVQETLEEAEALSGLLEQEPDFFEFLSTPVVSAKEKKAVLAKIFEGRLSTEIKNLMFILIDKGRVRHYPRIVRRYRYLLNESEGFSAGTVFSVIPLTPDQVGAFEEQTSRLMQKKIKLENRIDRNLIGGVRIFIEGKVIDASIKGRLNTLKELIANN
jgi:ATP synthase F1 delta subunit